MKILKIGFEFEVLVRQTQFSPVWSYIHNISSRIRCGGDGTVRGGFGWRDLEIKTDPLSYNQAIELFEKVIVHLIQLNEVGLIKTNKTCGLHINVSTNDLKRSYIKVLFNYDDKKYLKIWNRLNNKACEPFDFKIRDFSPSDYYLRYQGVKHVSVANRLTEDGKGARLENRIIGGPDYFLRCEEIKTTMEDFFDVITKE